MFGMVSRALIGMSVVSVHSVSVVGLGKLGACMAASFASRGFDVVGVDIRPETVEAINAGRAPIYEPGLDELVRANSRRLRATGSYFDAVRNSNMTFIVVPTPSTPEGAFSLRYATQAAGEVGRALRTKDAYHVVVLTSTVMPSSTERGLIPAIEAASGKRCGPDFGVCYSPEFIALGSVIRDFLNPDFLLIGESDHRAGELLASQCHRVVPEGTPVARMKLAEAELTKLAINSYVTAKITFANLLAALCERLPGANVDVVTRGLGLDTRIGRKYLTGALGYGGPCFPRDNVALSHFARTLGVDASVIEATDALNRRQGSRVAAMCAAHLAPGARVAVLGLSYKPDTIVVEESPGLYLAGALAGAGFEVVGYDPLVRHVGDDIPDEVKIVGEPWEALDGAQALILANPDPEFETPDFVALAAEATPQVIFDCWRRWQTHLDRFPGADYFAVGLAQVEAETDEALRLMVEQTLGDAL